MSRIFWNALKAAPALIAGSLVATNAVVAQTVPTGDNSVDATLEQINNYQDNNNGISQVTNVNQLRDVSPSDWAYEALRSLVDRYGCIAGFPNQTYRGNQALSRYEFAAGLNSCLSQIERLIASSEAVVREDIDTINRLTQEFEAELATLSGRVDDLEGRTAFLEDHQFSTTTKLGGEVIFAVGQVFGENVDSQVTFTDRVRLNFDSSFTGKDLLRTRLSAGNLDNAFRSGISGTNSTRVGFDLGGGNDIAIEDLYYRFPINDNVRIWAGTVGLDLDDVFYVTNPMLESSGTGALSRFTRRNPIVFRGVEGAGIGTNIDFSKFTFTALYLTNSDSADPSEGQGLFNGSYSAGGQLKFAPSENLDVAFTYVRSYETGEDVNLSGSTISTELDDLGNVVSGNASSPFGEVDTEANRFGLGANFLLGEKINLAGWGGYADASEIGGNSSADIWSWGASVGFLDVGKEGAVFAVAGGMPPRVTGGDGVTEDPDTSYIIEALYKYPINDNILLTPGAYVVLNPNHNENNDTVWVGVLRTTFKF